MQCLNKAGQDVSDVLNEMLPNNEVVKTRIPRGERGSGANVKQMGFSNEKAKCILGQVFTPFEEVVVDTFHSLCELEKKWK